MGGGVAPACAARLYGRTLCRLPMVCVPWYRYRLTFPHRFWLVRMVLNCKIKYLDAGGALAWKAAGLPTET